MGCTSIRSKEFIEGNIKERRLRDIWEDDDAFTWRRSMTKDKLSGSCKTCVYGSKCLGGCPNTRLTMKGSIYEENEYCAYNLSLKAYAMGGRALALYRLGKSEEGIELIRDAVNKSGGRDLNLLQDLQYMTSGKM